MYFSGWVGLGWQGTGGQEGVLNYVIASLSELDFCVFFDLMGCCCLDL